MGQLLRKCLFLPNGQLTQAPLEIDLETGQGYVDAGVRIKEPIKVEVCAPNVGEIEKCGRGKVKVFRFCAFSLRKTRCEEKDLLVTPLF
jgi:hypothetical protein